MEQTNPMKSPLRSSSVVERPYSQGISAAVIAFLVIARKSVQTHLPAYYFCLLLKHTPSQCPIIYMMIYMWA